jgi:putative membrane protein
LKHEPKFPDIQQAGTQQSHRPRRGCASFRPFRDCADGTSVVAYSDGSHSPTGSIPDGPGRQHGAGSNQYRRLADKAFVRKALQGGMTEVQLGQLALQKSSNADVKQFAQKMIDDHTKLGDEMKQVGQQMGIKGADSPSSKDKSAMAKMQALNGDDFDKAYIKDMVKDHQQDAKDFKQEAQTTTNPALKTVVVQGQQVIDEHLQMIQQIAQKNNVVASK